MSYNDLPNHGWGSTRRALLAEALDGWLALVGGVLRVSRWVGDGLQRAMTR